MMKEKERMGGGVPYDQNFVLQDEVWFLPELADGSPKHKKEKKEEEKKKETAQSSSGVSAVAATQLPRTWEERVAAAIAACDKNLQAMDPETRRMILEKSSEHSRSLKK
ncbi:hypothetical protein FLONG3_9382 [Fusarium longipes]|uniref:Uncharacterized protein n=1 Tax=Fusarium longipes TaxID=694270 RepID=A0A395RY89_9HYPO|nr:hypothetical protein FLONG3_9382 [Fusarium longipes]